MAEEEEGVLPMYVEEEDAEAEAVAGKQKRRQESSRKKKNRKEADGSGQVWRMISEEEMARLLAPHYSALEKISAFDPKTESIVPYRYSFCDLSVFNLDEESAVGAMRYSSMRGPELVPSVNIISLKVLASGVGYPVNIYGTVFVRDELGRKRICLFRRHRNNPQLVKCQDETLCLTGPSRGLLVFCYLYFEIDLKIKGSQQVDDRDFSKLFLKENAAVSAAQSISTQFTSKLSTMELTYQPVERAVEATVQIKILDGPSVEGGVLSPKGSAYFNGKITACTVGDGEFIDIILYDSKASGNVITVDDDGFIELSRSVVAVPIGQVLLLKIAVINHCHGVDLSTSTKRTLNFYPQVSSQNVVGFPCGSYVMRATIVWSALYIPQVDILSEMG